MDSTSKVIAVSPMPEALCIAAALRDEWAVLYPAGRKMILYTLDAWLKLSGIQSGVIILADIADPEAVRSRLMELHTKKAAVTWFTVDPRGAVAQACAGLEHVYLIKAVSLRDAALKLSEKLSRPHLLSEDFISSAGLAEFLTYRISLFLMKGFDPDYLAGAVDALCRQQVDRFDLPKLDAKDALSLGLFTHADFPYIEGSSQQISTLKERILTIAPTDLSTLIVGETGTGKEAVAFYLYEFSARKGRPFISLNCAGLDEHFLRSELFGHVKGSFTGAVSDKKGLVETADGGTLFLDELPDMPLKVQADLLRFLQTRQYRPLGSNEYKSADIRIITAAQPVIFEKLSQGEFRKDLYYRLAEIEVRTPRLRDIPTDIVHVVRHLAYKIDAPSYKPEETARRLEYFEANIDVLTAYSWPGNVRELAALVKRYLVLKDDIIEEIRQKIRSRKMPELNNSDSSAHCTDIRPVDSVVREYIRHICLHKGSLSQKEVATKLGVSVNTLKKYTAQ